MATAQFTVATQEQLADHHTTVYQVEDGTIFYWVNRSPSRLFVKWQGNEIDAVLPHDAIDCAEAFGNAIYFVASGKLYKAVFSSSNGSITISFLRDLLENEEFDRGLATSERNGQKYAYRMSEDPEKDGVQYSPLLHRLSMRRIHKSMIIWGSQIADATGISPYRLGANSIVIQSPDYRILKSYAPTDSCSFLYFAFGSDLHVLKTDKMKFLPPLQVDGIDYVADIAGVHTGTITLNCHHQGNFYLKTGQLPDGYFQASDS